MSNTYQQLLEWIEQARPQAWAISSGHPSLDAIEAVLELHKPVVTRYPSPTTYCAACHMYDPYPCSTVLAIESKILKEKS